jgi:hypothetical protein
MPGDRARDSWDPLRQYRSVVYQQGRVTLEADGNEAQRIAAENVRLETLDVVGPCGTPDDGYAVSGAGFPAISIGPGTMYVGGERVELHYALDYAAQPEWLDSADDPLWFDTSAHVRRQSELVYLLLREQEVSAVEDAVLREVALGGPDSAQRTRLTQRIVRGGAGADDCNSAMRLLREQWLQLGLRFDAKTMLLSSPATLQVQFAQQQVDEKPCDPQVQGGYLGADNQLIRVQITGFDANKKTGRLVWSYNNASFLYRVSRIDNQTLELLSAPVDVYHEPRVNRAVEILRSAVDLNHGDGLDLDHGNYAAAISGFVTSPAQAYVPETRRLVLVDPLPPPWQQPVGPLFLRVWEAEVPFTPGQAVDLAGTGLRVIIDWHGEPGALTIGQFWCFAVRPSTPVNLYPQRYLDAPQPPEGPRMWACPLATIGWPEAKFSLLEDCREKFDNLVELTKRHSACCSIVITPADVGGGSTLGKLLDSLSGQKATVSLQPGQYQLREPLVLTSKHDDLTLEGCHDGAVISAMKGFEEKFARGLVILEQVTSCTLRLLRFTLPLAPVRVARAAAVRSSAISIGVRVDGCADLHIEQCVFRFAAAQEVDLKAVAIYAESDCWNVRLERNRFLHSLQKAELTEGRLLVGFAAVPSASAAKNNGASSQFLPSTLQNTSIVGNEFAGLTMAVYVRADFGRIRCDNNVVHDCDGGFYFANTDIQVLREAVLEAARNRGRSQVHEAVFTDLIHASQAPVVTMMHEVSLLAGPASESQARKMVRIGQGPHPDAAKKIRAEARQANLDMVASRTAAATTGDNKPANAGAPASVEEAAARPEEEAAVSATEKAFAEKLRQLTAPFMVRVQDEAPATKHVPALRFVGNDIDMTPQARRGNTDLGVPTLIGLWAVAANDSGTRSVLVSSNDIRGSGERPLAIIVLQNAMVVAGNLILNENGKGGSLVVQGSRLAMMNISGNVLRGVAIINPPPGLVGFHPPPQPLRDGNGDWHVLNSTGP